MDLMVQMRSNCFFGLIALVGSEPLVLATSRSNRPVALLLRVAVGILAGAPVPIAAARVGVGGGARVGLSAIRRLCGCVGRRVGAGVAIPGARAGGGTGSVRAWGVRIVGRVRGVGCVGRGDERGGRGLGDCVRVGSFVSVAVEHARVDSAARIERKGS